VTTRSRPFAERNADIAARAAAGETLSDLALAFGVSRARIGQIVDAARAAEIAEAEADLEGAALRERARFGIELAATVDVQERYEILSFVVWPTPALAEASLFAVLDRLTAPPQRRQVAGRCPGCGVSFGDPPTQGCKPCGWRGAARRRRKRERELPQVRRGAAAAVVTTSSDVQDGEP
jgi:hypothetical protein